MSEAGKARAQRIVHDPAHGIHNLTVAQWDALKASIAAALDAAIAEEREACAKLAATPMSVGSWRDIEEAVGVRIAQAIRGRAKT